MAREVNDVIIKTIEKERGVPKDKAEQIVKGMRASGQYQEDVWS